jgi:hypothetical protein
MAADRTAAPSDRDDHMVGDDVAPTQTDTTETAGRRRIDLQNTFGDDGHAALGGDRTQRSIQPATIDDPAAAIGVE